jgi:hypothetical protein
VPAAQTSDIGDELRGYSLPTALGFRVTSSPPGLDTPGHTSCKPHHLDRVRQRICMKGIKGRGKADDDDDEVPRY